MFQASGRRFIKYENDKITEQKKITSVLMVLFLIFILSACNGGGGGGSADDNVDPNAKDRDNTPVVLKTEAPGDKEFGTSDAKVDYSNSDKGYIMVKYSGSNSKVKLQLSYKEKTYYYDLDTNGNWEAFPLSSGSGDYKVGIYEHLTGEQYKPLFTESFNAKLKDEFEPFLHPNQYVNYTDKSKAVVMSEEVCAGSKSDLGAVERMFNYVVDNIEYDYDKAKNVKSGYIPNIDETLNTGKGICFDYASVLGSMLRAQRIPCKLVIGYAGSAYHAWISVYTEETGWVENMIQFTGDKWTYMDPTFAASGNDSDPNLVGDGDTNNYKAEYFY